MKSVFGILGLLFIGSSVVGQAGKYGANPADSVKCIQNLSVYKDFVKEKDYDKAVKFWRIPYGLCPKSQKSLYSNGVKMYRAFVKKEKDINKQKVTLRVLFSFIRVFVLPSIKVREFF